MTHHSVDAATLRRAINLLERTWVGVADQDDLFRVIAVLRGALATPLNHDRVAAVIPSAQRVSS